MDFPWDWSGSGDILSGSLQISVALTAVFTNSIGFLMLSSSLSMDSFRPLLSPDGFLELGPKMVFHGLNTSDMSHLIGLPLLGTV